MDERVGVDDSTAQAAGSASDVAAGAPARSATASAAARTRSGRRRFPPAITL